MEKNVTQQEQTVVNEQPKSAGNSMPKIAGIPIGTLIGAAAVLILLCFAAGVGGSLLVSQSSPGSPVTLMAHGNGNDGNKIVTKEEEDISAVASKVAPSVVSVLTSSGVQTYRGTQTQEGAGTGIIVSSDGYVLTNKHVVADGQKFAVVTADGVTHTDVRVIGTDPLNDVAFLKINGVSNLKAAELGDSSSIRIGQKVVAIGNSLGQYQNTVTSGIISGTGRPIAAEASDGIESLTDLLQTDAAINPGNSGGPLTNLAGQVIGINTAIAQDAQSIGFSIPINATKGVIKSVLAHGKVERAYLGINYVSVTPDFASREKLAAPKGAYVYVDPTKPAVVAGGPADKAGVHEKDLITKVNDIEVGDRGSVSSLIGEYGAGDTVQLTLLRDGKQMTVAVKLEAYKG